MPKPLRATTSSSSPSDDIKLPAATDWRTTDQDEINRRILRAREEKFGIRNLAPRHPVHSDFEVKSQSGMTYTVEVHSVARREFHCNCVDFQVNGLGTCKHAEAVLAHLAATRKKDFSAARAKDNSTRIDITTGSATSALVVKRGAGRLRLGARAVSQGRMRDDLQLRRARRHACPVVHGRRR